MEAKGLEPSNLLTASQALYQLSYAPVGQTFSLLKQPRCPPDHPTASPRGPGQEGGEPATMPHEACEPGWGPSSSLAERRLQVTNVLLGLLEQGPERFGDVGKAEVVGVDESLPVPLQLFTLEPGIRTQGRGGVRALVDRGDVGRRRAAQKRHLLGEHLGMHQLLVTWRVSSATTPDSPRL